MRQNNPVLHQTQTHSDADTDTQTQTHGLRHRDAEITREKPNQVHERGKPNGQHQTEEAHGTRRGCTREREADEAWPHARAGRTPFRARATHMNTHGSTETRLITRKDTCSPNVATSTSGMDVVPLDPPSTNTASLHLTPVCWPSNIIPARATRPLMFDSTVYTCT